MQLPEGAHRKPRKGLNAFLEVFFEAVIGCKEKLKGVRNYPGVFSSLEPVRSAFAKRAKNSR
ncbi:MAG: hypothetical protein ABIJ44_04000 [Pseudomonadota bacterium]